MKAGAEIPFGRQFLFWLLVAAATIALFWLLSGMLLPFVLGMALAYVSDPFADRLERLFFPRWLASLLVLGLIVGLGMLTLVLVIPVVANQAMQLIEQTPHYLDLLRHRFLPQVTRFVAKVGGPHDAADVQKAASAYVGSVSSWVFGMLSQLWSSGLAIANVGYVMVLTPLVAFYFLRDWDRMVAKLDSWMPLRHRDQLRGLAREIDEILAGFIRGQATVCLIIGAYYSAALSLAGLDYAIIIGTAAGVLTFIPYLGSIAGLAASVTIAFIQFDSHLRIAIVAAVYILGHLVEGNLITPMLVGNRVKLHPVWIIFALMAGGALFGFTGVLLAVPVAAVVGVLVRFALRQYLGSHFYDNRVAPLPLVDPSELLAVAVIRRSKQLILQFENRVAHGVEDFLVAPGNRHAVDWIDRWPDWPFVALAIIGPPGCGKSHLAALWRARTGAAPIDLGMIGLEQTAALTADGGPILIEDCDRATTHPAAERRLLQLYNLARAAGGRLLLTARRPPSEWRIRLPDLASRLNSAMLATIDPPDDALLGSIAIKLFADRQVTVGEEVIAFLLNRGERTVTGVARAVDALDRASIALKRPITVPMARETLPQPNDAAEQA